MNEQKNQEEEEYEEEEIEVYEEVEVDEEVEASDITSSNKKPENKEDNNIKQEISKFNNTTTTNNSNNINIPQKNKVINNNRLEDIIDYNKENIQIINQNKDNNNNNNNDKEKVFTLDLNNINNNNDNVNIGINDNNKLLEEKIIFDKNNNNNIQIDYNNNIDNNMYNNENNIHFNNFNYNNINNNDFNFDFSNNFNFDNKNTENKYLNLDYKIIPGRESLDMLTNEIIISNNTLEKNDSNSIPNPNPNPNSMIELKDNHSDYFNNINNNNYNINNNDYFNHNDYFNNNIINNNTYNLNNNNYINNNKGNINNNNGNINNINNNIGNINNNYNNINNNNMQNKNMPRQPQGHRSKIRRNNNKKPLINVNKNNYNENDDDIDFNNYLIHGDDINNVNKEVNNNFNKKESYFRDNENNNYINSINNDNINNKCLPLAEIPIKTSLENIITSQNDYSNNYFFENQESININKNLLDYYNNPEESLLNNNTQNTQALQSNNINTNINNNNICDNNLKISEKEINMNEPELNLNLNPNINNINNNVQSGNNEINVENKILSEYNEQKQQVIDENKIINEKINEKELENTNNTTIDNKKRINMKKTKEEIEYENKLVEIIGNNEIIESLEGRKWEEKKQGFLKLNQYLNEKIDDKSIMENNFEIFFTFIVIKLNNFKETNFNLLKEGILCLQILFSYYKNKNILLDKKYLDKIILGLNEKIADSKLKEVYLQLLKLLIGIYSQKTVYSKLFDILLKTNKIAVLKEYAIYIKDNIKEQNSINDIDLKNMIDFIVKIANNTNPQIRSISIEIICLLYKFIGPDLKQLISGIKESTLKLIEKELEKINFDNNDNVNNNKNNNYKVKELLVDKNKVKKNNKVDLNLNNLQLSTSPSYINGNLSNTNLMNKRIDISKEITPKLLREINRGKWIEKKEGIEYINSVIDKANNKISKNGLQELFDLIKEKMNDGNINLVKITLQLLNHLIVALDNQIKAFYKIMVYPLLLKLSDKSKQIRDECHSCVENWIKLQNFEIFAVYLPQLLISTENFEMRNEILTLINKNKDLIKNDYPKLFFKELTKAFLTCLQDKNSIIRNSTEELIKILSNFIPREKYIMELKDIKRSISDYLYNIIDKLLPQIDTGVPAEIELAGDKNENADKEKEKDEDLKNESTILHHQKLSPSKKNNYRKKNNTKIDKKYEGSHSIDKSNSKTNKRETSFIKEIKNKNILNSPINSTLFENNNNNRDNTKKNDNNKNNSIINRKRKNKVVSCDKAISNNVKKIEKSKFNSLNISTDCNNSRNAKKRINNNKNNSVMDTSCRHDVGKRNKGARNRSMITTGKNTDRNSKDTINKTTINNYNTKKVVKSLTTEKNIRDKNNSNLNTSRISKQNQKNNNIKKEQPKKINYKKFLNINNNSNRKNQIFLPNYKIKKGTKEKRYEKDKRNNFYFEVQNFDYLPKINELLKTIFTPDFISKIFSNDLKLINTSLFQLKTLIDESINNNNDDNYNKLIDNLDLILKVIGIKVSSNQTASLIKSFFIFADTLINSYKIKNNIFNDTEINILLNIFADKLTNNNFILKETACNLIYFLNDQIDNSKTFIMLVHLLEYKSAKLKGEIIDIITKLYERSNFDTIIINKVLKTIIRAYFESDFNSKKKIINLLQDIYGSIRDDFWKHTKFLTSKERDELIKYLVPENENIYGEMDQKDTSQEYDIDDLNSSNFGEYDSENNEIIKNRRDTRNDNENNNNRILKLNGDNNYDYDYDNLKSNIQNKTITIEKRNKKHIFKRSITDNSKKEKKNEENNKNNFNTNSNITNIKDIKSFNNGNKENDSKCISEKELREALDMINTEEDLVEAIINIHSITCRNYLQNKSILHAKANDIIKCFIEIINKLFSQKPLPLKILKYYIVVLCKLCNIKEFIINISLNTQKNLIILILSNLLYENLNTLGDNDEGMAIWRNLNSIISHIIEYCKVTNNISIIIELEQKYRKEKPKLAEYSARCLVIITQNIKTTYNNIELNIIFSNIYSILNDFIKDTNDLQLKEKTDQTILITLRNLINELVKAKIDKILDDYNKWIKDSNITDEKYIINWINESLLRIKKIKNNDNEEDTNVNINVITNGNENKTINDNHINNNGNRNLKNENNIQDNGNNSEGKKIIIDNNKSNNLEDIKKRWKEVQEKNNINN